MRFAVVGHVEWVEFAVVERVPRAGEIVFATGPAFCEPGGGGAVAAVHLRRLAGACGFFTSVGSDANGRMTADALRAHGVELHAAVHDVPQRRAFTHLDGAHERTITVVGERHVPLGSDALPWDLLAGVDGLYFAGGDAAALRKARLARQLVATPRALDALVEGGVQLDVLVASASDLGERVDPGAIDPPPRHVVLTEGERGGSWTGADGTSGRWDAEPLPGPPVDAYGCGDAFAAGLAYGLGSGLDLPRALRVGARAGAAALTLRGPYGHPTPQPGQTP